MLMDLSLNPAVTGEMLTDVRAIHADSSKIRSEFIFYSSHLHVDLADFSGLDLRIGPGIPLQTFGFPIHETACFSE
jgi:hypothetical protein